MNTIFKAIGTLCIIAYITGLVSNMVEINHTQKAIRLVCAIYIISSLFIYSPKNEYREIDTTIDYNQSSVQNDTFDYIIQKTEKTVEDDIKKALDENFISYTDVKVHIYKQSEGIDISDITIYGVSDEDQNLALQSIGNVTSEEKIIFGD